MNETYAETFQSLYQYNMTPFEKTLSHFEHYCICHCCHKMLKLSNSETYRRFHNHKYRCLFFCKNCAADFFKISEEDIKDGRIASLGLITKTLNILKRLDTPYYEKYFVSAWHSFTENNPDMSVTDKYRHVLQKYLRRYSMINLAPLEYSDSLYLTLGDDYYK